MTGNRVIGSRVMTENGANLGNVSDIDADFATGQVLGYALVSGLMDRLRRQDEMVPVAAVKSIGDNLVVVGNEFTPAP
jgi:sporulation protein YlmC with PRC-barrel domain